MPYCNIIKSLPLRHWGWECIWVGRWRMLSPFHKFTNNQFLKISIFRSIIVFKCVASVMSGRRIAFCLTWANRLRSAPLSISRLFLVWLSVEDSDRSNIFLVTLIFFGGLFWYEFFFSSARAFLMAVCRHFVNIRSLSRAAAASIVSSLMESSQLLTIAMN